jgi:lathosterol oxidase
MSVFLGVCGLGAVLVLHFPQWLTSAELRAQYPVGAMRALIACVIGVGFLLGCVSMLLRRRKVLGATGTVLAGLAMVAGGWRVEIDGELDAPIYLGLDWFLLNLFVFALVFVPLERVFPRDRAQRVLRPGWATDTIYFAVSHLGIQLLTFLSLLPATLLAGALTGAAWRSAVQAQPLALQVFELMVVGDLAQYWVHRAFHRVPWLWPFHAVHHSCRELDWLAGSRLHLVDIVVTRAMVLVPVFLAGFAPAALYVWLVIIGLHATVNHVNLRFRARWIEQLVATPRFHHWHHAATPRDRNFAVHFPWIDRLFGTFHLPGGTWPERLGLEGDPVPEGYLAQLAYPFRQPSASPR